MTCCQISFSFALLVVRQILGDSTSASMIRPVLTFLKLISTKLRDIFQLEFERIHPPIKSTWISALTLYKTRFPQQFACVRRQTIYFKMCLLLHNRNRHTWNIGNKYVCVMRMHAFACNATYLAALLGPSRYDAF